MLIPFKEEGHFRKCIFFVLINKKTTLNWVTKRCLSFHSASDPNEIPLQRSTKTPHREPGRVFVTSIRTNWNWREAQTQLANFKCIAFRCSHFFFAVPELNSVWSVYIGDGTKHIRFLEWHSPLRFSWKCTPSSLLTFTILRSYLKWQQWDDLLQRSCWHKRVTSNRGSFNLATRHCTNPNKQE